MAFNVNFANSGLAFLSYGVTKNKNFAFDGQEYTFVYKVDNLNRDGYHLNDKGRLVAALTWHETFTGISALDTKFDLTAAIGTVLSTISTPWILT